VDTNGDDTPRTGVVRAQSWPRRHRSGGTLVSGPIVGDDGLARCPWGAGSEVYRAYHDEEWGRPISGESAYLERLTLEAFQSGLSWLTILNKRESFRAAFAEFDADRVAAFDDTDRARLMGDAGIVRNRLKIDAAITNAAATVRMREAGGLQEFVERFRPESRTPPVTTADIPATSPESAALSKALKKQGFVFVGPTTMYALMQAVGLVDDHLVGCHRSLVTRR
jgi:DNA-3-methyladenine glycosylase I